jgi:heme/copper-type cytochrome/quinol oxidase subunit 3
MAAGTVTYAAAIQRGGVMSRTIETTERPKPVINVSHLSTVAFGPANVSWLGNVFYMTIEGMMFVLTIAVYFYLRTRSITWPPAPQLPPSLKYGVASSIVFVLSVIPAWWAQSSAAARDKIKIRAALMLMTLVGTALIVVRVFEFTVLNCRWTDNGYASAVWILLGLHSGHLATEWCETVTLLVLSFTEKMEGTRIPDVAINSDYWYFVVATGLVSDFIIYGTTRLM